MKKLLIYLYLLFSNITLGQSAVADLKFEEAETAFNNGNYELTIQKIDEFEKIMGGMYTKSLYLRVISQNKLFIPENFYSDEKQFSKFVSLVTNSDKYIKATEKDGLDDKFKEIYTISQNLKKLNLTKDKTIWLKEKKRLEKIELDKQKALLAKKEQCKKTFDELTIDNMPFGITLEEFRKQYPNILLDNYKTIVPKWISSTSTMRFCYTKNINFENKQRLILPYNSSTGEPIYDNSIHAVIIENDRVVGYQKNIFYYNSKGQGNLDYQSAISQLNLQLEKYRKDFEPCVDNNTEDNIHHYTSNDQEGWTTEGKNIIFKQFVLFSDVYVDEKNPKRWKCSLTMRIYKPYNNNQ